MNRRLPLLTLIAALACGPALAAQQDRRPDEANQTTRTYASQTWDTGGQANRPAQWPGATEIRTPLTAVNDRASYVARNVGFNPERIRDEFELRDNGVRVTPWAGRGGAGLSLVNRF